MNNLNTLTPCAALPLVSEGEGAAASSPGSRPLTIDTKCLGDLFLPAERKEWASVSLLNKLSRAACRAGKDARQEALVVALCAVEREWRQTVETIRERGGLLLIGGAA